MYRPSTFGGVTDLLSGSIRVGMAGSVVLGILFCNAPAFAFPARALHAREAIQDLGIAGPDVRRAFEDISGIIDSDVRHGQFKGNHRNFGHWGFSGDIPFNSNPALREYVSRNPGAKQEIIKAWSECNRKIENRIVEAMGIPAGRQAHGVAAFVGDHHLLCDYADKLIEPLQPVSEIQRDLIKAAQDTFGARCDFANQLRERFDAIPQGLSAPEKARWTLDAVGEASFGEQMEKTFARPFAEGKLRVVDVTSKPHFADAFALGKTLVKSNTIETATLDELITKVAGKPSLKAFHKYEGSFARYWERSASQRAGKVFEAMVAYSENRRLARAGSRMRFVATAAEGNPGHAADMLVADASSVIRERQQYKLGWKAARDALGDAKYCGMTIVTPADQMEVLANELAKAEAKAVRRGKELAPEWNAVREAIKEGRITSRLRSGALTPTLEDIFRVTKRQLQNQWTTLGRLAKATGIAAVAKARPIAGTVKVVGRVVGKVLIVVDVGATGYQTYNDVNRYRAGEIGGAYLGAKTTMRGVQLSLAYYTVFAPDPTFVTKVATGVAVVILIAADDISDRVYEARRDQARQLLESINRDERFYAARKQLLESN